MVDGLVVGHRCAGLECLVVQLFSEGGARRCDGGALVGPCGSAAVFGREEGGGDAVEDGCLFEVVEADQDLDSPQDAVVEGEASAVLVGSLDRFAEVTGHVGKVAGADAHACR